MAAVSLTTRAPAKVNLTLHVLGRRADGYHDLESLVAFAGIGDTLTLTPDLPLQVTLDGPAADAAGVEDNLVLRAARNLAERRPGLTLGAFHLVKRLPVAAGLGGGSSDAAAALRLLARLNRLAIDHPAVLEAARATGADVPVCLAPRARMMRGIGDELGSSLELPRLFAVLVNPGVPVPTGAVFGALGLRVGEPRGRNAHRSIEPRHPDEFLDWIRRGSNDLEAPALRVAPAIGEALALLGAAEGCRLARMSGSGATVFGLFDNSEAMAQAGKVLRRVRPGWWVKSSVFR